MYYIDYRAMGDRIRKKRKEMQLTQEKLAEMIDISTSHVGGIERGKAVCSLDVLVNLTIVLGLNLDTLVKGVNCENAGNAFTELLENMSNDNQQIYIKICEGIAEKLT